jgi:hypothetical protein
MTAVDLYKPRDLAVPDPHDTDSWIAIASDVIKIANVIHDTPFVPDGLRGSAPAVAAAILAGRELGIGPMTALQHIHVIKGKPAQSAALMRALIQAQGHQWRDIEVTNTRVIIEGKRAGESEWARAQFTADDAKQAGIQLGGYPQDKLYARATSRLARRKFADVIAGMPYSAEDLEDGSETETITETIAPAADANGHNPPPAAPKPRTAQRRTRTVSKTPAPAAPDEPPESGPAAGAGLPPLPGEDEPAPEKDKAPAWVGLIVQHFNRLSITDRDERLIMTTRIAGRPEPVESTKDLNDLERKRVLDTLSRCKDRGQLVALLAEGDKPDT